MKKLLSILLAVVMLLSVFAFSVSAVGGVGVELLNENLQKGEGASLLVTFNTQVEVQALSYIIEYDPSSLKLVSVSGGQYNNYESGKIAYINTGEKITCDKATFVFRTLAAGDTTVKITDICAADNQEYTFNDVSFPFSVNPPTKGDVNGDSKVDTIDLAALKLYLAGVASEINAFADYNGDSRIDAMDLALLKLYLAEG